MNAIKYALSLPVALAQIVMALLVSAIQIARTLPTMIQARMLQGYIACMRAKRKLRGEPLWKPQDWRLLGVPPPQEMHEADCRAHVKNGQPPHFCNCALMQDGSEI